MNREMKYDHPNSVWEQIKWNIELRIIKGTLKSADKVPSISDLALEFGVGKTTACKAIESLHKEGTITKQKGIGFFVEPYMREKLKEKHMISLRVSFEGNISLAKELDIDVTKLEDALRGMFESVSSR